MEFLSLSAIISDPPDITTQIVAVNNLAIHDFGPLFARHWPESRVYSIEIVSPLKSPDDDGAEFRWNLDQVDKPRIFY